MRWDTEIGECVDCNACTYIDTDVDVDTDIDMWTDIQTDR